LFGIVRLKRNTYNYNHTARACPFNMQFAVWLYVSGFISDFQKK
jgi:hypothetical protein